MEWTAPKVPAKVALTGPALELHNGFHRAAFETGSAMRTLIGAALRAINAQVHKAFGKDPEAYAAATMMAAGMPKPSAYASVAAMRCYLAAPDVAATLPVEGLMAIGAAAKRSKDPAKTVKAMMSTARRNGGTARGATRQRREERPGSDRRQDQARGPCRNDCPTPSAATSRHQ